MFRSRDLDGERVSSRPRRLVDGGPHSANRRRRRPILDALEDRCLLSTYRVTNTLDSGAGSLRAAILLANANAGRDDIEFNIPASTAVDLDVPVPGFDPVTQNWTITLQSPLPRITDSVWIDGYTQADSGVPYRYPDAVSLAVQSVALLGSPTGGTFSLTTLSPLPAGTTVDIPFNANAATVQAALAAVIGVGNVTVGGGPAPDAAFTITFGGAYARQTLLELQSQSNLTGGTNPGVVVQTLGVGGTPVEEPDWITSSPNTKRAVDGNDAHIRVIVDVSGLSAATGFELAASHSILRGLVIRNFDVGVYVPALDASGNPAVGNLIQGNAIGDYFYFPVDPQTGEPLTGAGAVGYRFDAGNARQGVIVAANNTTIGGVNPQESNIISGNGEQGIRIVPGGTGNQVLGNQIGMAGPSLNGLYAQDGNGAEGVMVESSGSASDPLHIAWTSSNQIKGNVISGNLSTGVRLVGVGAIRNLIQANLIGVAPGGGYRFGSGDPGNQADGILLEDAGQNLIGGSTADLGNAISSNHGAGIRITGPSATGNVISNNMIGLTADGTQVLGNAEAGVALYSADNTVGPGNVISQNRLGIGIHGPGATRTLVVDNFIGTDVGGTHYGFGNAFEGIRIENSPANTIQGDATGSQVISGNRVGIAIFGAASTGNLVVGNFVGTDETGLSDLSNKDAGIYIAAPSNTVGGNTTNARNLISSNHTGVHLVGTDATGNLIQGNDIGTDITGLSPLSNEVLGVLFSDLASGNTVGGSTADLGNKIWFHEQDGVRVESGTGNTILSNSIWLNRRLGIDLVDPLDPPNGVTPDPVPPASPVRPGPNRLQAYPVLDHATSNGTLTHIVGTLYSAPNSTFLIQFFTSPAPDPSGYGQGQKRFGSAQVTSGPDGIAAVDVLLTTPLAPGVYLSATATNLSTGDTSEFARDITVSTAMLFSADTYSVVESAGTAIITVIRTLVSGTSTVNYSTVDTGTALPYVDYTPVSGTLTFLPGVSTKTFAVTILDDAQLEAAVETVNLALSDATGGYVDFRITSVLRIIDNDVNSSRILYVTNTNDSGPGSLRQAILEANGNPGRDDIEFAIPASTDPYLNVPVPGFDPTTQTWSIDLETALPTITDPVTIDGYTQAHFPVPYRYPDAFTSTQILNMTGNPTGGSFTLRTQSPLPNLSTNELPYDVTASHLNLELISIFGSRNVVVSGGPANVAPLVISFVGDYQGYTPPLLVPSVHLTGGIDPEVTLTQSVSLKDPIPIVSSPNTIDARDGNDAHARVIISGNQIVGGGPGFVIDTSNSMLRGLIIDGFTTGVLIPRDENVGNLIQGNSIGAYFLYPVNPSSGEALQSPYNVSIAGLGNSREGIVIRGANTIVGGTQPQENNVIANSGLQGVLIDVGAHGNVIAGNQIGIIGPSVNGRYARVPNRLEGVLIYGSSNAVGGPGATSGNLISANLGAGVRIVGPESTRNIIGANFIGLGPGGGYSYGTGNPGNGGDGILIEDSTSNQIGGPGATWGNVISSNNGSGVLITGEIAVGNAVLYNFIGLTADGAATRGNADDGIRIESPQTTVGPGNVISGNLRGVHVAGAAASEALINDNLIGTDATGSIDLGNALEGVLIEDATDAQVVGDGGGSQVISGNRAGVVITGTTSTRNRIAGNLIGSDKTGKAPIPNAREGVAILNSPANTVGGATTSARNLISANHWGVRIEGTHATGTLVQGNLIGTDITGTAPLGNEVNGVIVAGDASNNLIGGSATSAGNAIAFNALAGVLIQSGTGNSILSNSIWANGRLGIDLAGPLDPPSGVTPSLPGLRVGPNNLQSAPVIVTAVAGSSAGSIQGTLTSVGNSRFTVQFFRSQVPDPSGYGEGQTLIGSTEVTTDAQGNATFSFSPQESLSQNAWISSTATNQATGDTSEFSNTVSAQPVSVEFLTATSSVDVTAGSILIHVRRSGNPNAIVSVNYATSNGTAVAGRDYDAASGTLTFQVGQMDKTFQVVVLPNPAQTASSVTVNMALSDPTGGATIGSIGSSVLTIQNNLPPTLEFRSATYSVYSTSPTALITVIRGGGSRGTAVSVGYRTSGGTASPGVDYTPVSGTLNFLANQTTATFSVPILPGSHPAGTVTVGLFLENPTAGAEVGDLGEASLRITTTSVNPINPTDKTPPQVTSRQLLLGPSGISAVSFTFSKSMDPVRAQDLGNYGYYAILAGRDGRFGTSDDTHVPLASAAYDPATWSVMVTPTAPLPWNQFARIVLNGLANPVLGRGLTDTSGNLLSGQGNGIAGDPYIASFCVGTGFSYLDASGKPIRLGLTGGGLIQVFSSVSGDPQSVTLIGTVPRKSVLDLHAGKGGGRYTYMPPIQGTAGVKIRYRPPSAFRSYPVIPTTPARLNRASVRRLR